MEHSQKVIRFDWALKHNLRDKANFDVLEGFLGALLKQEVKVLKILESESNQQEAQQKFNRVDLLIEDEQGRQIIIEIQNDYESDYLERLIFGTSKTIIENLELGTPYKQIKKVISISILYFPLGKGDDYVYYGTTQLKGMHSQQPLVIREKVYDASQQREFLVEKRNLFPEYYLIRVDYFKDQIESDLDEWIYWLKHEEIKDEFHSKHIQKARQKFLVLQLSKKERRAYERYLMDLVRERDIIQSAQSEGEDRVRPQLQQIREEREQALKREEQALEREEQALKEKEQALKEKEQALKEKEQLLALLKKHSINPN